MKRISILGSTGSIGVNTLDIVSRFPERFEVTGLAAGANIGLLEKQIEAFAPEYVSVNEESTARILREKGYKNVSHGVEGAVRVATAPEADIVVSAIVGAAGLLPTLAAIRSRKDIALANKETLVIAGELIMKEVKSSGVTIIPVDSEHSAIFQAIAGHNRNEIRKIILTASGGPFLGCSRERLKKVTVDEALKHPKWQMGRKISIDSASLMNKGLEVIEARWLFDIPPEKIDVHIHPQSIIHSMVEYVDGSVIAQMGIPDMRIPISYALTYPERLSVDLPALDFFSIDKLSFLKPDRDLFPLLDLAYAALNSGGIMPAVLNAANEVSVEAFLKGKIGFLDIPEMVKETIDRTENYEASCVEDFLAADTSARARVQNMIDGR